MAEQVRIAVDQPVEPDAGMALEGVLALFCRRLEQQRAAWLDRGASR